MSTINKIKELVQKDSAEDLANNRLYIKLVEVLQKFEDKEISKRIATGVQTAFGESYSVHYSREYSFYSLIIRLKSEPYDSGKTFVLGYNSDPVFRVSDFEKYNSWAGTAAVERIKQNANVLASGKIEKLADLHDQIAALQEQINELGLESYTFPAYYAVNRLLKGKE